MPPRMLRRRRLIPAHAGKTRDGVLKSMSIGAHPRSRGENPGRPSSKLGDQGSSPLTRGKLRSRLARLPRSGLIPAHAGKTLDSELGRIDSRAHPRSRGENAAPISTALTYSGSSPLTRGKPLVQAKRIREEGLIPAHAGKTYCVVVDGHAARAHPRSRGENSVASLRKRRPPGSSPLTRGKRGREHRRVNVHGLIPAHAGKTS